MKLKRFVIVMFIPIVYFLVSLITNSDYGFNWDEPYHFAKGNASLHYLLTGNKDYTDLPAYAPVLKGSSDYMDQYGVEAPDYVTSPKSVLDLESKVARSRFESDLWTYDYLTSKNILGHPEVNDLLAAFTNFIFFKKLGIVGDLESYHLFEIFSTFLIVTAVGLITYSQLGLLASVVATLSLSIYPLFFSEAHFNIKDPVLASFYGLTVIFFYKAIQKINWKYLILSSVFLGLAIGTKFNALFVGPTLALWLVIHVLFLKRNKRREMFTKIKKDILFIISFVFYPLVFLFTFFILSPTTWPNIVDKFVTIVNYYKQIGVGVPAELSKYVIHGINTYPFFWFVITTQIPLLILLVIGITYSIYLVAKEKNSFLVLVLFWFFVPFIRVSIGNTNIYGGIRQIMEFLPAMAILIGLGAKYLHTTLKYKKMTLLVISVVLAVSLWEIVKIHPNENVYFNQIIGGLSGATEKNIPYAGNSFGNVYLQGVEWLNKNAPKNSKLALPINTPFFVPRTKLRSDIAFSNAYLSLDKHEGEYVMEHYFDWAPMAWYRYDYYDTFMNTVYEVKVDGIPILKIWKNSPEYIKQGHEKESYYKPDPVFVNGTSLNISLSEVIKLTELKITHGSKKCSKQIPGYGYILLSKDGENWDRFPEEIYFPQAKLYENEFGDRVKTFLFAAKEAKFIKVDTQIEDACIIQNPNVVVKGLGQ